jgi:hypothetical protein
MFFPAIVYSPYKSVPPVLTLFSFYCPVGCDDDVSPTEVSLNLFSLDEASLTDVSRHRTAYRLWIITAAIGRNLRHPSKFGDGLTLHLLSNSL